MSVAAPLVIAYNRASTSSPGYWLVSVVIGLIFAWACSAIARRKGRGPLLWGVLVFFFSLLALIIVAILPRRSGVATT